MTLNKDTKTALLGLISGIDHCDYGLRMVSDPGIQMILEGLLKAAHSAGLTSTTPKIGSPFNPHIMEATQSVEAETDNDEPHTIHAVLLRGWSYQGMVLRPANVSVFKEKKKMEKEKPQGQVKPHTVRRARKKRKK